MIDLISRLTHLSDQLIGQIFLKGPFNNVLSPGNQMRTLQGF